MAYNVLGDPVEPDDDVRNSTQADAANAAPIARVATMTMFGNVARLRADQAIYAAMTSASDVPV